MRIGNGAADQIQQDIYGEAIDSICASTPTGWGAAASATKAGRTSGGCINWLSENWDQPDEGIWETRGGRRDSRTGG